MPHILQKLAKISTKSTVRYYVHYSSIRSAVFRDSDFDGWPHINYGAMIEEDIMKEYFKRQNIEEDDYCQEEKELTRLAKQYETADGSWPLSFETDENEEVYHIMTHGLIENAEFPLPDEPKD